MRQALLGLIGALLMSLPTMGAETLSESHKQLAAELLNVMNIEKTTMTLVPLTFDRMIHGVAAPYKDVILKWAEKYLTWETFGPRFVALYAESFTEAELRDMLTFYKTPTGQKVIVVIPELMRRGAMVGEEVAKEHEQELAEMIEARAAELAKPDTKP